MQTRRSHQDRYILTWDASVRRKRRLLPATCCPAPATPREGIRAKTTYPPPPTCSPQISSPSLSRTEHRDSGSWGCREERKEVTEAAPHFRCRISASSKVKHSREARQEEV
ncbi:hypothetical protein E2C01_100482 [Portunus trituberculatus]|uniref:Uncharacterized protein n=1 Tax=Portunus trituberculatus TaxID=210409 RepID=A0A5B7KJJ8_PORTR|nr:hypothetical protein [Portunus trituberculatus]